MSQRDEQIKAELIANLASQVRNRLPAAQASVAESFVRQYFERVAAEDLAEHSPVDLYGAALAHWSLARVRLPAVSAHV